MKKIAAAAALPVDQLAELGVSIGAEAEAVAPAVAVAPAAPAIVADAGEVPADAPKPRGVVDLDTPIVRGSTTIAQVVVRKPASGELRGLTIGALSQGDVDQVTKLLPRITIPALTLQEVKALDPADFTQFTGEVLDFLLPSAAKQG